MDDKEKSKIIETFLIDNVVLGETRENRIRDGAMVIEKLLKNSEPFKDLFVELAPQGSFRNGTSIKPITDGDDFDLDLLFTLKQVDGWYPKDYLSNLHDFFYNLDRYKKIVDTRGKTRCVTLDYAVGDFHIDLVPCIDFQGQKLIMNKKDDVFENTDGDGYAKWFYNQNNIANGYLAQAIQLLKYVRDYKNTFSIKSVVLTTILGNQVRHDDSLNFSDLSSALRLLLQRVDDYLQVNFSMPDVYNPAMPSEKFTDRHWTTDQYDNFREMFHVYTEKILNGLESQDPDIFESELQEVFGDRLQIINKNNFDPALGDFSHRKNSRWVEEIRNDAVVEIRAMLTNTRGRAWMVKSNSFVAFPKYELKYIASVYKVDEPFEVWWQVVNTGDHAASVVGGLRGDYFIGKKISGEPSQEKLVNFEKTEYHGRHWIECFVIKDNSIIARSGPFYVRVNNPNWRSYKKPKR